MSNIVRELGVEESRLMDGVCNEIEGESYLAMGFAVCAGINSSNRRQEVVKSTIYHYTRGLRGRKLRKQVVEDYGFVNILLILQFAYFIMQIVVILRDLLNKDNTLSN